MEELNTKVNELTLLAVQEKHYRDVVDVINASDRAIVGHNIVTYDEFMNDLNSLETNPATDTCVVLSPSGETLGYSDFWAGPEPHVRLYGFVRIHPQHRGEGIGTAITDWLETRAAQELAKAPAGLRVTLGMRAYAAQTNAHEFLENRGFLHARSSYRMTIDLDESIPQPIFPPGFTLRTIGSDETYLRLALQAEQEAFLDHYGVMPEPFEAYFKRRKHYLLNEPGTDLSVCYMVLEGDDVVAVDFNAISLADDQNTGWVGTLSVRRPWRKHGLGLALLLNAFHELGKCGKSRVGLYVDAENLTGALRLYQKAGMHVDYENRYFEKELRPGIDLANKG